MSHCQTKSLQREWALKAGGTCERTATQMLKTQRMGVALRQTQSLPRWAKDNSVPEHTMFVAAKGSECTVGPLDGVKGKRS